MSHVFVSQPATRQFFCGLCVTTSAILGSGDGHITVPLFTRGGGSVALRCRFCWLSSTASGGVCAV
jgi:hypothetical protein